MPSFDRLYDGLGLIGSLGFRVRVQGERLRVFGVGVFGLGCWVKGMSTLDQLKL